jgi:TATA-binding protein-associated factor Taf7
MTTQTFTPTDIVNFAATKDAVNLTTAFNDLVSQKMLDAIQARKQTVASAMFNEPEAEQEEIEAAAEEGQEAEETVDSNEQPEQETEDSNEDAEQHA